MMTDRPRLFVLSDSQPKKKTTPRARKPPTLASAFAWMRVKPRAIMMVGVYVVSEDQVEKTAKVEMKDGQRR